jgi:ATP-binding cassette, subfamily B, multidrug efflux pump
LRMLKYLKGHLGAVVAVFALLIVLAFCDMMLPSYTSNIVDVGIQQSGVENVSTTQLSASTHDAVAAQLSGDDAQLFADAYARQSDGTWALTDQGRANRDALDSAMTLPMVEVYFPGQNEDDTDSVLSQKAILAAENEYQALGADLTTIQMDYLKGVGLAMLGIAAISMIGNILVDLIASRTGAKIARDLRSRVYSKVIRLSQAQVDSFSTASLITRCTNDIQLIQMTEVMFLRMVLYSPILAVAGIVMVARTNISMAWVIVLAVVALFLVIGLLMAVAMPKFRLMQKLIDKINLVSREILTGLPVIRAFGREKHEEERFAQANGQLLSTQLFTNRAMAFMMPAMQLIMNGTSVAIVWVGSHYVDAGTIQTGDLIAFITYSMLVVMSFLMIGMISIMLPRAGVAADRVEEVLASEPSVADKPGVQPAQLSDELGARIEFDDVSFAYEGTDKGVLEHVSFVAEPGKTLAIIGATGSGKSTVVKLIERFYDVTGGRVLLDGVDVRDMPLSQLRSNLGYSPQKAFLFSGTVDSNVGFSDLEMPQQRKQLAVQVAQASDFVGQREGGMQAEVAQGGSNLSGGQRQRLAIARALAADARAYIFDDSFSALDYKTDALLRAELAQKLSGKTVVIVAQRIATVMGADRIVVLSEGRVAGVGTHSELLQSCPEYLEIAQSQLSKEELGKGVSAHDAQ